jgi:argininosuccinate lyase
MYATDRAIDAAKSGTPFRDAYKAAAAIPMGSTNSDAKNDGRTPHRSLVERTSPGGAGRLMLEALFERLQSLS